MNLEIYKSKDELYLSWWLDELIEAGYLNNYNYEDKTWLLTSPIRLQRKKYLKTKEKIEYRELLKAHSYNCDFVLNFNEKAYYYFFENIDVSIKNIHTPFFSIWYNKIYIEAKPEFDQNNMTREFKLNQKWVYNKYKDYINLIIPYSKKSTCLFAKTFTPKKVIIEEVYKNSKVGKYNKGESKIRYKIVRTLENYILSVKELAKKERWNKKLILNNLKGYE